MTEVSRALRRVLRHLSGSQPLPLDNVHVGQRIGSSWHPDGPHVCDDLHLWPYPDCLRRRSLRNAGVACCDLQRG